jgi:N-glycosylase/DNA lyase
VKKARLAELPAPLLDLELTLNCGQVFHWRGHGAGWIGAIDETTVYAEHRGDVLLVNEDAVEIAARYFALDHPLEEIAGSFPTDEAMVAAARFCRGLRIVRQPAWEAVATFITSALKQVPHIAQISHTLRERYGKELKLPEGIADMAGASAGNTRVSSYPSAARLAALDEAALRECKLGFRAKSLLGTARRIAAGEIDLLQLGALPDDEARATLCTLPGVGEKIANCALLFGFERLRAFPIDVWIERVLRAIYFAKKRNVTREKLGTFSATYFGPYGGYAQQYLFHHARKTWKKAVG